MKAAYWSLTAAFALIVLGSLWSAPPEPRVVRPGPPVCDCGDGCDCGAGCRCGFVAVPDKAKKEPKPAPVVDLSMASNWGKVSHDAGSGAITITGHPLWDAVGEVRKDGSVFLLWTLKSTGQPCPGVYKVHSDKSLTGAWGFGGSVIVEPDGSLSGETHDDQIYPAPVPVD